MHEIKKWCSYAPMLFTCMNLSLVDYLAIFQKMRKCKALFKRWCKKEAVNEWEIEHSNGLNFKYNTYCYCSSKCWVANPDLNKNRMAWKKGFNLWHSLFNNHRIKHNENYFTNERGINWPISHYANKQVITTKLLLWQELASMSWFIASPFFF